MAPDFLGCVVCVFGIGQNVVDMNDFAFEQDPPRHYTSVDSSRVTCNELGKFVRDPVGRLEVEGSAFRSTQDYGVCLAQLCRRFDQRVEHRLQIEGRAADDLEHVGGGGLLLQRFPQLVEQARILDGDDGLVRKVRNYFDLLVGERPDLLTVDDNGADEVVVLEHGHANHCADAGEIGCGNRQLMAI